MFCVLLARDKSFRTAGSSLWICYLPEETGTRCGDAVVTQFVGIGCDRIANRKSMLVDEK